MDLKDEIRNLAYELYEKSGKVAGRDFDNWLEAEKIVQARQGGKKNPKTGLSSSKNKSASTGKKSVKKVSI